MQMPLLKIEESREGPLVVFRLTGKIVAETVPALARAVEQAETREGFRDLHFDAVGVEYIDSRGIGALLGWHQHFFERESDFRLLNIEGEALRTLRICNMTSVLNLGPRPKDLAEMVRKKCRSLWASYEYAEQVLAALGEGLIGLDPQGRCLFVNRSAERLLGWSEGDLLGQPFHDLIELFDDSGRLVAQEVSPMVLCAREGKKPFHGEYCIRHKDRKTKTPVGVIATPIFASDAIVGAVVGLLDITDRKRVEEALRIAARLEATATLAGGLSHEFNNLMVGVLGYAEILKADLAGLPEAQSTLAKISEAAQRSSDLAEQLLAYAQEGKRTPKTMNLNSSIEETLQMRAPSVHARVRLERDLEPALWIVRADPGQMRQVLSALLVNAVESIEGEGRVLIATHNVELDRQTATRFGELPPGRYVRLAVQDTGCGMTPEVVSRVFEPFFSTKSQGRGLGLAAAYGIVKNHEGHITVSTAKGRGTTFEVYLPTIDRGGGKPSRASEWDASDLPKTVLVVDDEEVVRQVMQTILERAGYKVLAAVNGPEAIEIARTHAEEIHVAFLDMDMPIMDATQVLPLLKKVRPAMRVIICSGYTLDAVAQGLLQSGADSFLSKPFRPETLEAEVRRALGG